MKKILVLILLSIGAFSYVHSDNVVRQSLHVNDASDIDRLWERYFATKNVDCIKQILEVINQDPGVMMFAYEYQNRIKIAETLSSIKGKMVEPELDDLRAAMAQYEKRLPDALNRICIVTAAMWSLDDNLSRYPQLTEDCRVLITNNPQLDYRKKIRAFLGK